MLLEQLRERRRTGNRPGLDFILLQSVYVDAMTRTYLPTQPSDPTAWESALYAFLSEKQRRSGSDRTVHAYSAMPQQFFGQAGKTPDEVTSQDIFAFAHGEGLAGKQPSSVTIGARIACISSFCKFLIRYGMLTANPCDAIERPKVQSSTPRGLSTDEVHRLLAVIPDTVPGRRDRAIILTLLLTARRRTEVLSLKAKDIAFQEGRPYYNYRGKGGKLGRRELPAPAYQAMLTTLADAGKTLETMEPEESLWCAGSPNGGHLQLDVLHAPAQVPAGGRHQRFGRTRTPPYGGQAAS